MFFYTRKNKIGAISWSLQIMTICGWDGKQKSYVEKEKLRNIFDSLSSCFMSATHKTQVFRNTYSGTPERYFFLVEKHSSEIRIQTSIWQQLLSDFWAIQW